MKFFTWNTQGSFASQPKLAVIEKFFDGGYDVGFLQEGGVDEAGHYAKFVAVAGLSVGAKNERCTNYVLIGKALWNKGAGKDKIDLFKKVQGGGEAGRTPAAVQLGDVCFVSWHSISSSDNSDTGMLVDHCAKIIWMDHSLNYIVIGGDFNASPKDVDELIGRRAKHYGGIGFDCLYASDDTHKSGKELDFFVVMSRKAVDYTAWPQVMGVVPSDHNPVTIDVEMT